MTQPNDLLAQLADIDPASALAQARATRDAATRHAQGSYEVLFSQQENDFPLAEGLRWRRRSPNGTVPKSWARTMPPIRHFSRWGTPHAISRRALLLSA